MITDISLPYEAAKIISILENHGYEAYVVGGCVRDSLIGREPKDWDITTNATPEIVRSVFHRTIDTGIEHGTVTVRMGGKGFEVTTYRIDGNYSDGRHPDFVDFSTELREDLKRRDFTVNAMAYHPDRGLIDMFGGISDLNAAIIRCVGDPVERFGEDALRMLRALRFAAQLDFSLDEDTYLAIKDMHKRIAMVSEERIQAELIKLLVSDHPQMMKLVYETGLSSVFLPEFDRLFETPQNTRHHDTDVGNHTIRVLMGLPADRVMRLAGLFHDIAKPISRKTDNKGIDHFVGHPGVGAQMTRDIMLRLKFDKATMHRVESLVRFHDERITVNPRNVRRLASRIGSEHMPGLITLKKADVMAQSDFEREKKLSDIDDMEKCYIMSVNNQEPLTVKDLKIDGRDLKQEGIEQGPKIGNILKSLLSEVVDDPNKNTRSFLLARARKLSCLLLCFMIMLSGCVPVSDSSSDTTEEETVLEEEEETDIDEARRLEEEMLLSDSYLLEDISTKEERVILKSLSTLKRYRFAFGLSTAFLDKWGSRTSQSDFVKGSVVKIGKARNNVLSSISLSSDAWVVEDLTNFSYDKDREIFKIGETKYRIRPSVNVFSGNLSVTMDDITDQDSLRVVGIDKNIISVTVTTGHGYISLMNTDFFKDSMISIGSKIYTTITKDTVIPVSAGKYKITVAKGGYGGSTTVRVKKNETVTVNLDTLKGEGPKQCKLILKSTVKGTKAFVDDNKVKLNKRFKIDYGQHKIRVEVPDYDAWQKTLLVNSPRSDINVDPEEVKNAKKEAQKNAANSSASNSSQNDNNSSNNSSNNSNNNNNNNSSSNNNNSSSNGSSSNSSGSSSSNSNKSSNNNSGSSTNSSSNNSNTGTFNSTHNPFANKDGSNSSSNSSNNTSGNSNNRNSNNSSSTDNSSNSNTSSSGNYNGANYGRTDDDEDSDSSSSSSSVTDTSRQAELDYLDTLSNMITQITDQATP